MLNAKEITKKPIFTKEIATQLEPFWKAITEYQTSEFFKRLSIKLKYLLIRDHRAECKVPQHLLEESKRGFEEW